jgi:hypothetical protein
MDTLARTLYKGVRTPQTHTEAYTTRDGAVARGLAREVVRPLSVCGAACGAGRGGRTSCVK